MILLCVVDGESKIWCTGKLSDIGMHQSFYEVDRFICLLYSKVRFIAKFYLYTCWGILSFEINFFFLEEKYCNLQNSLMKY